MKRTLKKEGETRLSLIKILKTLKISLTESLINWIKM